MLERQTASVFEVAVATLFFTDNFYPLTEPKFVDTGSATEIHTDRELGDLSLHAVLRRAVQCVRVCLSEDLIEVSF